HVRDRGGTTGRPRPPARADLVLLGPGHRRPRRGGHRLLAAAARPRRRRPPGHRRPGPAALPHAALGGVRAPGAPAAGRVPRRTGPARDGGHRARRARRGGGQVHGPRRPPPDAARPPRLRLPPPERPATGPDPAAPALPGLVRAHRAAAARPGPSPPHGPAGGP